MLEEYEKKRRKQESFMRSVLDYGMGFLFIVLGVLIFMRDNLTLGEGESYKLNVPTKVIGPIFVLYGIWRLYKGYKKNYFN
jgi:hypothetical protein